MSANGAAMARAMGVQYWIWNKQQYSVKGNAVVRTRYGGPNPHTDHVHIEMNLAGSKLQTSYWRIAGGDRLVRRSIGADRSGPLRGALPARRSFVPLPGGPFRSR